MKAAPRDTARIKHDANVSLSVGESVTECMGSSVSYVTVDFTSGSSVLESHILVQIPNANSVIYACVYHPTSAYADDMLEHLYTTTQKLMKTHKSAKFVICGDFNKLEMADFQRNFNLQQIVDFNTR